jgi:hypothetical protein
MGRDLGPNPAPNNGLCQPDTKIFQVVSYLGRVFFSCFEPAHQAQTKCTPIPTPATAREQVERNGAPRHEVVPRAVLPPRPPPRLLRRHAK